jgi:hypothetical protein
VGCTLKTQGRHRPYHPLLLGRREVYCRPEQQGLVICFEDDMGSSCRSLQSIVHYLAFGGTMVSKEFCCWVGISCSSYFWLRLSSTLLFKRGILAFKCCLSSFLYLA